MKHRLFVQVLAGVTRAFAIATLILSSTVATNQPTDANGITFFCGKDKGIPATKARIQRGDRTIVRWVSDDYFPRDLTPQKRCTQVSRRFQKNLDNQNLKTIITGTLNKQPVVCAAVSTNDTCTNSTLLFTLKRGANPRLAMQRILDRRGLERGEILNQSSDNTQIYIDFNTYINSLSVEP
ncbi:MAG: COP23 domain-containing protein [Desmonostoc vinosum HA7617-LM4]|jgi:hypothetical protein|nr:COP23 domain-containing protein [Desmonostoc vinosum HA7617-LM4]